jgi:hypothetical protein
VSNMRTQCHWMPPEITQLYILRAAYERAGCPRAIVTDTDIEAEMAEVARRRELLARGDLGGLFGGMR